jgi:hypothetical protein
VPHPISLVPLNQQSEGGEAGPSRSDDHDRSRKGTIMKIDPNRSVFGPPNLAAVAGAEGQAVRRLQVRGRAGIWEVIQDDRFYGHYMGYQAAFAAAEAAALVIVADGGAADLRFNQGQVRQGVGRPGGGSGGPVSAVRTMEFRAGSVPVVR